MKRLCIYLLTIALIVGVALLLKSHFKQSLNGESPISDNLQMLSDISGETNHTPIALSMEDLEKIVFEKCQKLAESGDKNAQYRLACYYEMGFYVPKSIAQAMRWYNQAARQEHPAAWNKVGLYYEIGVLQPKNYEKAFKSYLKGADGGDAEAQASLGRFYYYGMGCSTSKLMAVYYLQRAAEKGDIDAKYLLGKCYANGEGGLSKDAKMAKKLYAEAAEGGHNLAAEDLKNIQD